MSAILGFVLLAIVALIVVSFAAHVLFTPWILVPLAILAWVKFRPGRTRR